MDSRNRSNAGETVTRTANTVFIKLGRDVKHLTINHYLALVTSILKKVNISTKIIVLASISLTVLRFFLHYLADFIEFVLFEYTFKCWLLIVQIITIAAIKPYRKNQVFLIFIDFSIIGFVFFFIYYVITMDNLNKLDWEMNSSKMKSIVQLAKEKRLRQIYDDTYRIPFSKTLIPYIKSNKAQVLYQGDTTVTVTFITGGLLDHYSAFVYSNAKDALKGLEEKTHRGGTDYKIQQGWYFTDR